MESSVRIAAVILNYKTPELSLAAVRSLYGELDPGQDVIIVVDNCSGDDSLAEIRHGLASDAWPGNIQLCESGFNGGFSYGNNFGMAKVEAEAYLLLNSDAGVFPGAVKQLWAELQADSARALVGPLVVDDRNVEQVSCFVNRSPWNELLTTAKTGLLSKLFAGFGVKELVLQPGLPARDVDWLSFVCVLLRAGAYRDIGPMDEGYFMYREDNDYCRRARLKGWTVHYAPLAKVMHLNKGWSAKQFARQPTFYYESRSRYFRKYYGLAGLLCANLLWTLGRLIHWFREVLQGLPPSAAAYAWKDIWIMRFGSKPISHDA